MNEMQVFTNPEFGRLRTILIDEAPWAVGKDVAVALGYEKPLNALYAHVDKDDTLKQGVTDNMGRTQNTIIINESGLYSLILSSKLPSAKRFKRWVTSEVLPAIRRTGAYSVQNATPPTTPQREFTTDDYIRAASIIAGCKNERLPYVLNLLTQGGFTVPTVEHIRTEASKDTSGECARLINLAISDHGMGTREIGRITGLQATQITRIRTGASIPTVARSNIIISAIKNELPEIE